MNDDFLYKRQEEPSPEFIESLRGTLAAMELPEKAKRKNGQRRFSWKAVAAVFVVLALAGLVIFSQTKLRDSIVNVFIDDPNYDTLVDVYERYGFELPTVPSRYELALAFYNDEENENIEIRWQSTVCVIRLKVGLPDITDEVTGISIIPEPLVETFKTGYQIIGEVRNLDGDNTERIWASWSLFNGSFYRHYSLTTGNSCLSQSEILTIAQSTFSDNP